MTQDQPTIPTDQPQGRPAPNPPAPGAQDHNPQEIVSGIVAGLANAIWVLRAPLAIAVLALVMLSVPPQMVEVYVTLAQTMLAEETVMIGTAQIVLALISVIGLCMILWVIGRDLSLIDNRANPDLGRKTTHGIILRNLPGILAALPLLGLAYGLFIASQAMSTYAGFLPDLSDEPVTEENYGISKSVSMIQQRTGDVPSTWRNDFTEIISEIDKALEPTKDLFSSLLSGSMICLALGLAFLLYSLWRANTKLYKFEKFTPKIVGSAPGVITAFLVTIAFIAFFAMQSASAGGIIGFDVTAISRFLGSIVILTVFLMCFAIFASTLTRTYDKYWIPVISILLIIALGASYTNSNDNHVVRLIDASPAAPKLASEQPPANTPPARVPRLDEAFSAWLSKREALDSYNGEPYPVYIVAAQGGGLYSANLSAITLARLYDRCAQLKDHLFAISGVSGGGVGAGLVNALLQASEKVPAAKSQSSCDPSMPEPGWLETQVKHYLAEDFLSPLAGTALFPDVLQRFIPYPPIGIFDRARAFEASLEQTFPKMLVENNPLQAPFLSTWQPDGSTPMLVLNSTLVEGGRQVVIAPVAFGVTSELRSVYEPSVNSGQNPCPTASPNGSCFIPLIDENQDLPFSTALGLSARYPIVMPAGTLINDDVRSRLVDGGYFENSGIETALSIIRDIEGTICPRDAGDAGTCTITDPESGAQRRLQFKLIILTEDYDLHYASEGLNEILSPIRALYRTRLERGQLARQRATTSRNDVHIIRIDHELFPLPLGWQFSSPTQGLIGAQIAESAPCLSGLAVETIRVHLEREASSQGSDFVKIDTDKMNRLVALVNDNRCNLRAILTAISKKPAPRPVAPPANLSPPPDTTPAPVNQTPQ